MRHRASRLIVIVALAACVAACTNGFVYNRLDTVARWYIGSVVTLDDVQQQSLRDWLGRTLEWHRGNELVRYEAFVRAAADRVAYGPDAALPGEAAGEAERFVRALLGQVAPEATNLLLGLRPPQVGELIGNLEKRANEEIEEEQERTDANRVQRRIRSLSRSLDRWTGDVTADQKVLIEQTVAGLAAAGYLGEDDEWLASQAAWRDGLGTALASGDRGRVESLLRDPEQAYTPAHRTEEAAKRRAYLDFAAALDRTLTDRQRATLVARLTTLADDLRALQAR